MLNAGLPLATQQLLEICQRVLPKARQYPVQTAICVYYIYILNIAFPSSSSILIHPNVSTVSLEVLVEFLRGRKLGIAVQINFIQFAFESSEYQKGI